MTPRRGEAASLTHAPNAHCPWPCARLGHQQPPQPAECLPRALSAAVPGVQLEAASICSGRLSVICFGLTRPPHRDRVVEFDKRFDAENALLTPTAKVLNGRQLNLDWHVASGTPGAPRQSHNQQPQELTFDDSTGHADGGYKGAHEA